MLVGAARGGCGQVKTGKIELKEAHPKRWKRLSKLARKFIQVLLLDRSALPLRPCPPPLPSAPSAASAHPRARAVTDGWLISHDSPLVAGLARALG